ncbi:MAG: MFS transporter [Gemmataceae bacterium]
MHAQAELIPVTIASAGVVGVLVALLGSIKLPLAQRLCIDETRVGFLVAALFAAVVPLMLFGGLLIDSWGVKWVLTGGSFLTCLALFGLAVSRSFGQALGCVLLIGAGSAFLANSSVVLMPPAFHPDNKAAATNLGNVFFGIGALVTPFLAHGLINYLGFRRGLGLLAVVCLAPASAAALTTTDAFPVHEATGALQSVWRHPVLWFVGVGFALYIPIEATVSAWTTTLLTRRGVREGRAALVLSGFWLSLVVSRLVDWFIGFPKWSSPWLVLGLALAAAVVIGNLAFTEKRSHAIWLTLLAGFTLGPIFPTLAGILLEFFPVQQHGTAFGAAILIGSLGGLTLPPVIGQFARHHSIEGAMYVNVVLAAVLGLLACVFGLWLVV